MAETAESENTVPSSNSATQTPDRQCYICMRKDRKLFHLCLVNGGDNSLFSLLCDNEDDAPDGEKEPTRLIICWDCDAIMSKVLRFRQQANKAQRRLSSIVEGRNMAQNTYLVIPPLARARPQGHEPHSFLEYQSGAQAESQTLLRVVRYGPSLLYMLAERKQREPKAAFPPEMCYAAMLRRLVPDESPAPLSRPPLPAGVDHQAALLRLLGGPNH